MYDRVETYYLTVVSPFKGESVIASVQTTDRFLAEKMFGCGFLNQKHFGFDGLYTEQEVHHMFRPGTDITGSMNPVTGQFLKHKDYTKVPVFYMNGDQIYRIKNNQHIVLALSVKQNDFDYVWNVISGKVAPVMNTHVQNKQSVQAIPLVPKSPLMVDSYISFVKQMDEDVIEPEINELSAVDLFDMDDFDNLEFYDKPDMDVYAVLKQSRKKDTDQDLEYVSNMDSWFYEAQKTVISIEDDFKKPGEFQNKLQERFKLNIGQPIKKQGQSLRELFSGTLAK